MYAEVTRNPRQKYHIDIDIQLYDNDGRGDKSDEIVGGDIKVR